MLTSGANPTSRARSLLVERATDRRQIGPRSALQRGGALAQDVLQDATVGEVLALLRRIDARDHGECFLRAGCRGAHRELLLRRDTARDALDRDQLVAGEAD